MADGAQVNDQRSVGEIIGDVVANAQEMIRTEIRLAKTELLNEAKDAARSTGMLAAGAVLALFAFGMLLFTAVWALDTAMPQWAAGLIVTIAVAIPAAIMVMVGRSKLKQIEPRPEQTIESMKENVEWIRRQTH
jgi:uncharacterized membrane protein YqjE